MIMLSWGRGIQSTTLAAMSALGKLERLDAVIHADTGWERGRTYEDGAWYTGWLERCGLPVEVVGNGDIRRLGAEEHVHIPFWSASGGPLRRQCTRHFKITPIRRRVRELAGYHATKAPHPRPGEIELWIGISLDEYHRMSPSRVRFIRHRWPLVELRMTRWDCIDFLEERGLPVPVKSACIGCPYRKASEWIEMREQSPDEFAQAVAFDERNRCNPLAGCGSTADQLYIWKGGPEPLAGVDLEAAAARERQAQQLPLFVLPGWPGA